MEIDRYHYLDRSTRQAGIRRKSPLPTTRLAKVYNASADVRPDPSKPTTHTRTRYLTVVVYFSLPASPPTFHPPRTVDGVLFRLRLLHKPEKLPHQPRPPRSTTPVGSNLIFRPFLPGKTLGCAYRRCPLSCHAEKTMLFAEAPRRCPLHIYVNGAPPPNHRRTAAAALEKTDQQAPGASPAATFPSAALTARGGEMAPPPRTDF